MGAGSNRPGTGNTAFIVFTFNTLLAIGRPRRNGGAVLNLVANFGAIGLHQAGWRHPDSYRDTAMRLDHAIEVARIAEAGKMDALFLADANGVYDMDVPELFEANYPSARPTAFEPTTYLAAISQHTSRIGLIATATTTYDEPYLLARRFASLDHLSNGRAAWNVVTGTNVSDARNFSHDEHVDRVTRYERSVEALEVAKGLWDSWAGDAFVQDHATGRYLDHERVRTLDHQGVHFKVQGPLNVARCPQGWPAVFLAGQSELGLEMAAQHADAVFAISLTVEQGRAHYADLKGRMEKYGRDPDHLRILPGATVCVKESSAEANDLYDELQSLISPEVGVAYLSKMIDHDLRGLPLDGPLPDLDGDVVGGSSMRAKIVDLAQTRGLSIRKTYESVLQAPIVLIKGNPVEVADEIEEWYTTKASDGFIVGAPVLPTGLEDFVRLVVPELQRRGLFRTEYAGSTLRDLMGMAPAPDPWAR
ncbi:MAG: LLM class flavin-dependent oxidoreductase [Acidimicrobiia bacterium]